MRQARGVLPRRDDAVMKSPSASGTIVVVRLDPALPAAQTQAWLAGADRLVQEIRAGHDEDGRRTGTVPVGFGPSFFRRADGTERFPGVEPPAGFDRLPPVPGSADAAADLAFYVMATRPHVPAALLTGLRALGPAAVRIEEERGHKRPGDTEPFGYKDGVRNVARGDRPGIVFVDRDELPEEPAWADRGTYMAWMKIPQDLAAFAALPAPEQDQLVGRDRGGRRLDLPAPSRVEPADTTALPPASHVRKAGPRGGPRDRTQIFRRGMPYAEAAGGQAAAGLHFVSFQASLDQLRTVLNRWMLNPDFPTPGCGAAPLLRRGLIRIERHGFFLVPPDTDEPLGATIFAAAKDKPKPPRTGRIAVRKRVVDAAGAELDVGPGRVRLHRRRPRDRSERRRAVRDQQPRARAVRGPADRRAAAPGRDRCPGRLHGLPARPVPPRRRAARPARRQHRRPRRRLRRRAAVSSPDSIRRRIADAQAKRQDAEHKAADAGTAQARKAQEAADRRASAARTSSATSARSYLRQAEQAEQAALDHGKKAAGHSRRSADLLKTETALGKDLASALGAQARDDDRARDRAARQDKAARDRAVRDERAARERLAADQAALSRSLVRDAEQRVRAEIAAVRPPAARPLKILYLTAAARGDLLVEEEIRRVRNGVRAATHRDLVQIEHLPAATPGDLLDGLARVTPDVVHFSGHAAEGLVELAAGSDTSGPGLAVAAGAFARAVGAVDPPPVLVVLNACRSAAQLAGLVGHVPLAIGMADTVGDRDAIAFAARFYAAVAEGQPIQAALDLARAQMEIDGLPDHELPVLAARAGVDPSAVRLVIPPEHRRTGGEAA